CCPVGLPGPVKRRHPWTNQTLLSWRTDLTAFCALPLPPMVHEPLVSILMSNYNYGQYISEAVESVLRQTYTRLELVVCDDGSTDRSCEVIEAYRRQDRRITLICKQNG